MKATKTVTGAGRRQESPPARVSRGGGGGGGASAKQPTAFEVPSLSSGAGVAPVVVTDTGERKDLRDARSPQALGPSADAQTSKA